MRSFIAKIIYMFAQSITSAMSNVRRSDTLCRAAMMLANLELETKHGNIQVNIGNINEIPGTIGVLHVEHDTVEWIESMPEYSCFWDIGANVGIFSMIAAKNVINVYSFEPQAFTFSTLMKNLQLNGMAEKVNAFQIAFCDRTRIDILNMSSIESGAAFNTFGENTDQYGKIVDNYSYNMMGYTIDDFINIFHPCIPTHIKIDVDGLEPQILKGGVKTFNSKKIKSVIIETEGCESRINEIHEIMHNYGFTIRSMKKVNITIYDRE